MPQKPYSWTTANEVLNYLRTQITDEDLACGNRAMLTSSLFQILERLGESPVSWALHNQIVAKLIRGEKMSVEEENKLLRDAIRDAAETMEQWAKQSRSGGWSTHQVKPNNDKAQELYALLGRLSRR